MCNRSTINSSDWTEVTCDSELEYIRELKEELGFLGYRTMTRKDSGSGRIRLLVLTEGVSNMAALRKRVADFAREWRLTCD